MTQRTQELLQKALALTEEERAELAGSLMESLDSVVDADAESAWQSQIAQRLADLDSGKARTIGWREVQNQLTARLRHGLKGS
jgi:putative addiction module component (TIGR02574 family)